MNSKEETLTIKREKGSIVPSDSINPPARSWFDFSHIQINHNE